eukprot:TRINITY_DN16295_c0_g1_i1.p1 TRINITY_DN16295_c0_g1~~TRINITY_DN16295_c0_g1_i1.p1  ORF type:complete len:860 (-),score=126.67 TRINITY_DN16295_c0_g1_i1:454-3033(-)
MTTLSIQKLETLVDAAVAASSEGEMSHQLIPAMLVLRSKALISRSFRHGVDEESRHDYSGISELFERLCSHTTNRYACQAAEELRSVSLEVFGGQRGHGDESLAEGTDVREIGRHSSASSVSVESTAGAPTAMFAGGSDVVDVVGDINTPVVTASAKKSGNKDFAVVADAPETNVGGLERCESAAEHMGKNTSCMPCLGSDIQKTDDAAHTWVPALVAAVLPLMADVLPRDANGICVIPHRHTMIKQQVSEGSLYMTSAGRLAFRTNKICDNCQSPICARYFFRCSENCDIIYCLECNTRLEKVFHIFFEHTDANGNEDSGSRYKRLKWVLTVVEHVAFHVMQLSAADRKKLAHEFAFEWPTSMFERFVRVLIDVVNAKVVHVQDVKDIQSDESFWYAIGLLQFLYSANALPCKTKRFDEQGSKGPKLEYDNFILEGINKCEPTSEWQRWRKHQSKKLPDVLGIPEFRLTADFCCFLTHTNLVPVSFRRMCLLCDVRGLTRPGIGRVIPLEIKVNREPKLLLQNVLSRFDNLSESELRSPLRVTFESEEGTGIGVTKEFFQVALRSFLNGTGIAGLFTYNEQHRTYWFYETSNQSEAFRACGILLGQAVLNNILIPNIFPRVLYDLLLHDLGSPCSRTLGLDSLAMVDTEMAASLQRIFDYEDDDIHEAFGNIGWPATAELREGSRLTQSNKGDFLQAYIDWFFHDRISAQFGPFSGGFRTILGRSSLLRYMVDAVQLEKIICGASDPVDIVAIRQGTKLVGWNNEDDFYLECFWNGVENFTETEKTQFVVFVTASDRVPLGGWQDLQLRLQKNGDGDDQLPTAHTCFCQLLLPKYSSIEKLKTKLRLAIANSEGFGLR